MTKRRNVLIGIGGTLALAGCTSEEPDYEEGDVNGESEPETETESEPEIESEDEDDESEDGEAIFEFTDITPNEDTYTTEESFALGVWITNTGDSVGEQTIEFFVDDEFVDDGNFELDPGEERDVGMEVRGSIFNTGTWDFTAKSEDDEISSTFTIEEPEPEPSEEDIEITEHELVVDEGDFYTDVYVEGVVSNNADTMARYVQVTVRVYNEAGNQLDSYIDNTNDLSGGGTWAFEVMIFEDAEDIADYDIAVEDIRF